MTIVLFLRSLLFYIGYIISLFVWACFCLIVGLFLPLKRRFMLFTMWNAFAIWWLKICCNIQVELSGEENLPSEPYILLSNHQSPWETIYLYRQFLPISAILKKELLRIPFFGWTMALLKPIAIDRSKKISASRMLLQQGQQHLKNGISIMIFPEGTRVDPGQKKAYSSGGAALAIESRVKIVPLAHNAGLYWPARRFLKYPGTIKAVLGRPVDTEGRDPKELTRELEAWIRSSIESN